MTFPVLLTGGNGQLAWDIKRRAPEHSILLRSFTHAELDIVDAAAVARSLDAVRPAVVINAGSYTAVDKAETDAATAFTVNGDASGNLSAACAKRDIVLIHVSTDYVFNGNKSTPYTEDDPVAPINVYGASKLMGEQAIRDSGARHVILRTAWMYGAHGHNFVKTMLRLARERDRLRVVDDQHGCPTSSHDLAEAILKLTGQLGAGPVASDGLGTFHCVASGATTWCGFAREIFRLAAPALERVPVVDAISATEYRAPARRPANSTLDCAKLRKAHGITLRPWQEALAAVLPELIAAQAPAPVRPAAELRQGQV